MKERFVDYLKLFGMVCFVIVSIIPFAVMALIAQIIRHIIKAFYHAVATTRTYIGYEFNIIADYANGIERDDYLESFEEYVEKLTEDGNR